MTALATGAVAVDWAPAAEPEPQTPPDVCPTCGRGPDAEQQARARWLAWAHLRRPVSVD